MRTRFANPCIATSHINVSKYTFLNPVSLHPVSSKLFGTPNSSTLLTKSESPNKQCHRSVRSGQSSSQAHTTNDPSGKSEGPLDAAFSKKPRPSPESIDEAQLTEAELNALSHAELVQTAIVLQKALAASKDAGTAVPKQSASIWTAEKVTEKSKTVRALVHKEIKKQMKWQPSCKTGSTRWSYKGVVPCQEVFDEVFGNEKGAKKQWKMKKFSKSEFVGIFGHIEASVSTAKSAGCASDDTNLVLSVGITI